MKPKNKKLQSGLYVIADMQLVSADNLLKCCADALEGGAVIVQYRDKNPHHPNKLENAEKLNQLCHRFGVPLIINDHVDLAHKIGAAGVHLGKDDVSLEQARQILGKTAIIGVSCYNMPARALKAQDAGADYVAFGRFYKSTTKPNATSADITLLSEIKPSINIPIVAIGGITYQNGLKLLTAGADVLAVAQGIFGEKDIRTAAQKLSELFSL